MKQSLWEKMFWEILDTVTCFVVGGALVIVILYLAALLPQ